MTNMTDPQPTPSHDASQFQAAARQTSERQQIAQSRVKRERDRLLRDWTSGGGSEADFDEAWPAIHAQLGKIRVMEIGDKARNRSLTAFRKRA